MIPTTYIPKVSRGDFPFEAVSQVLMNRLKNYGILLIRNKCDLPNATLIRAESSVK